MNRVVESYRRQAAELEAQAAADPIHAHEYRLLAQAWRDLAEAASTWRRPPRHEPRTFQPRGD